MNDDRPTAYPRCGSTDPDVRGRIQRGDDWYAPCYWSWHDRPTDDLPAGNPPWSIEAQQAAAARIRELEAERDALKQEVTALGDDFEDAMNERDAFDTECKRLTTLGNALADAARPYAHGPSHYSTPITAAINAWRNR